MRTKRMTGHGLYGVMLCIAFVMTALFLAGCGWDAALETTDHARGTEETAQTNVPVSPAEDTEDTSKNTSEKETEDNMFRGDKLPEKEKKREEYYRLLHEKYGVTKEELTEANVDVIKLYEEYNPEDRGITDGDSLRQFIKTRGFGFEVNTFEAFYEILEMEPNGGLEAGMRLRGLYLYRHGRGGMGKLYHYFDLKNDLFYERHMPPRALGKEPAEKLRSIADECRIDTWDADIGDPEENHSTGGRFTWKIVFVTEEDTFHAYNGVSWNHNNYPADFEKFLEIIDEAESSADVQETVAESDVDKFYSALELRAKGGLREGTELRGIYMMWHMSNLPVKRYYIDIENGLYYDRDAMSHELAEGMAGKLAMITDNYQIYSWEAENFLDENVPGSTGSYLWKYVFEATDGTRYVYEGYTQEHKNVPPHFDEFEEFVAEAVDGE